MKTGIRITLVFLIALLQTVRVQAEITDKFEASIIISGTEQVYNETGKQVTITTIPAGLSVSVTYNSGSTLPVNAGNYHVVAVINDTYYQGQATATMKINKATATINLSNTNQIYTGTSNPVLVTTNPSGLSTEVTYNGNSIPPVNVGSYKVEISVSDANYQGRATSVLSISKAPATIMLSKLTTTYKGTPQEVSISTIPAGLSYTVTYDGSTSKPINAGTYRTSIVVNDPNYRGTASSNFTIYKAEADIIVSGKEVIYDGNNKSVNVTTIPSGLVVDLTFNGSPVIPVNAGIYEVSATINDDNYEGSVGDKLIISKANATINISKNEQVYDGNEKTISVETIPSSLNYSILYNGNSEHPVNVGIYNTEVTISDNNYQGSNSVDLIINKARATIILSNTHKVYDGLFQPVEVQTIPAGLNYSILYNGLEGIPVNNGQYLTKVEIDDDNYSGIVVDTLFISQDTAQVFISGLITTFDGTEKQPVVTTFPTDLCIEILYNGSTIKPVDAGTYVVEARITCSNYCGRVIETMKIQKCEQTITWDHNLSGLAPGEIIDLDAIASSDLEIIYTSSNPEVATISGSKLIIVGAGQATIYACQKGNSNYQKAAVVSKVIVVSPSSVDKTVSAQVSCWPNPTSDYLSIGLETDKEVEVQLYNQAGMFVEKQFITGINPQLDLSELTSGLYFVKMNYNLIDYCFKISKL